MCRQCLGWPEEGIGFPGLCVTHGHEAPHRCWELNSVSLQEQQVLLIDPALTKEIFIGLFGSNYLILNSWQFLIYKVFWRPLAFSWVICVSMQQPQSVQIPKNVLTACFAARRSHTMVLSSQFLVSRVLKQYKGIIPSNISFQKSVCPSNTAFVLDLSENT